MDNITIRCVVFKDPDETSWTAVALDLDIVTEADSRDAAMAELNELIEIQIGFAASRGEVSSIWKDAPDEYWAKYNEARRFHAAAIYGQGADSVDEAASDVPFPRPQSAEDFHLQTA